MSRIGRKRRNAAGPTVEDNAWGWRESKPRGSRNEAENPVEDGPKKPPAGRCAPRFAPPAKRVGASAIVAVE